MTRLSQRPASAAEATHRSHAGDRDDQPKPTYPGGEPSRRTANARKKTHLDHRIAMSMAVAGLASRNGVLVDDTRPIATSFPTFEALLAGAMANEPGAA